MATKKVDPNTQRVRYRLQLDVTQKTFDRINKLREKEGISLGECFERAFRLYEMVSEAQEAGEKILRESPGQEPRFREIVII